jgi:hypothetical protein
MPHQRNLAAASSSPGTSTSELEKDAHTQQERMPQLTPNDDGSDSHGASNLVAAGMYTTSVGMTTIAATTPPPPERAHLPFTMANATPAALTGRCDDAMRGVSVVLHGRGVQPSVLLPFFLSFLVCTDDEDSMNSTTTAIRIQSNRTLPARIIPDFADYRTLGKSIRMGHLLESQHGLANIVSVGSLQQGGIPMGVPRNSSTLNESISPSVARYLQQQDMRRRNHKLGSLSGPMTDQAAMHRYQ